ncbi:MAG: heavy metal-binding domain-containing protein [Limisphaerales bacterium]
MTVCESMMKVNRRWLVGVAVLVFALIAVLRPWRGAGPEKRQILYYQDSMHPWVKLDQPGKCTICAMDLTPIYEGDQAFTSVKLGRQGDSEWEVLSGVFAGERVVTAGNVLIDAQAQMMHPLDDEDEDGDASNGSLEVDGGHLEIVPGNDVRLNSLQEAALAALLEVADAVSEALSADDAGRFAAEWSRLGHELGEVGQLFGPGTQLQDVVGAVVAGYQSEAGADLESAREAFLPFSTALVELVQSLRLLPGDFRSVKVYHCPMAPKPGLWFQAEGPLANPFYGSEMLPCETAVWRGRWRLRRRCLSLPKR